MKTLKKIIKTKISNRLTVSAVYAFLIVFTINAGCSQIERNSKSKERYNAVDAYKKTTSVLNQDSINKDNARGHITVLK